MPGIWEGRERKPHAEILIAETGQERGPVHIDNEIYIPQHLPQGLAGSVGGCQLLKCRFFANLDLAVCNGGGVECSVWFGCRRYDGMRWMIDVSRVGCCGG